jgi:TolB-like protein/Tfp pilus assembly protein PilF
LSFFDELKRRNVFRVGIAYLIGGWLVIQVADIVLENIGVPAWVMKVILLIIVLGFFVSLFFAWAFEATPEGLKRESEVDRSKSITRVTGRKLDRSIIVMLVIALAYFVWESRVSDRAPVSVSADASVAVLAFENMSPDPENAFFAEGISEEILNVLAAVDGLRVASRTSAFSFANSDTPIPEIASQLGVAHVLEGSVRKQGMRVRITAQLIDASNDAHLWSDTYDRDLDDIFAVQEEIAVAISDALMGALGMAQVIVAAPTDDMAAYELFLRGRQQFYERGFEALESAAADLEVAVARDPEFADAWSFLAASLATIPGYKLMTAADTEEYVRRSEEAAKRALALDPKQAFAVAVRGVNATGVNRTLSLELYDRAAEMAPDNAGILMWAGNELYWSGAYVDEALPLLERAYRLDPLSGINNGVLGIAYLAAGQRELAYQHIRRADELGWPYALDSMMFDLVHRGETDAAIETQRAYWPTDESAATDEDRAKRELSHRVLRREITSDELADVIANTGLFAGDFVRQVHFYRILGDYERLFDAWLAIESDYEYLFRYIYLPGGRPAMEHPRMIEVAEKQLLFPLWESKGYPFGCERVQDQIGDHLSCPNWPD